MNEAGNALLALAAQLRDEGTPISAHVVDPDEPPVHGPLAAAGPRASEAPGEYSIVVEAVREGYLLHYGAPRLLAGHDEDLALLAGDYLYALGIERLAALRDAAAVAELSDLISLSAQLHGEGRAALAEPLWRASALAVGNGASPDHEAAKAALRAGNPEASELLQALLDSALAQDRTDLASG